MAITTIMSQGTQVYVCDVPATEWADCTEAIAGVQAGDVVGCPQSIGNIEETRTATEYKCLSSNDTAKAMGSISRGSLELGLLLDPEDQLGQQALKEAFANNTEIIIGIELSDKDTAGTSGTIYWFHAYVSAVSTGIEQDAAITYTVTVEIAGEINECAKS